MTKLKFIYSIVFFCLTSLVSFSQTLATIDSLENSYKNCLDKGNNMLACSKTYYNQMDSLLNLRYKKLRLSCDKVQQENLKNEQLDWLSKRDKEFQSNQNQLRKGNENNGSIGGSDELMILTDTNAEFVKLRVIELINSTSKDYSQENYNINPTGFYLLDSKTETKNGETYGYSGDIEVKKIDHNKIALRLFVCKGAPSYNLGLLSDTLIMKNNKAEYTNARIDNSCKIIFTFLKHGISVEEKTENYNFGCGFGNAVIANGFYKRKSYKVPTDEELKAE